MLQRTPQSSDYGPNGNMNSNSIVDTFPFDRSYNMITKVIIGNETQ